MQCCFISLEPMSFHVGFCFRTDVFFFFLNQLGRVNELLIKPDLSDLTEQKEEDVVEESVEEENGSGSDCVSTATMLETALNLVKVSMKLLEISF